LFPAVAGLFLFYETTKVEEVEEVKTVILFLQRSSGLTGVAKYLDNRRLYYWQAEMQRNKKTRNLLIGECVASIWKAVSTVDQWCG